MRTVLGLLAALALLTMTACDNGDDDPNNVPRTVPPTGVDGAAATAPAKIIKGTGPKIEATAQPAVALA